MEKRSISYNDIWKIAIPIMIGGIAQNLVNVTDTAFLGQVGKIELGAAGNAGILYFLFVITGMGFTTGTQIIIGRRNGEKNYHAIGKLVDQAFYFMLPLGLLLSAFLILLGPRIMEFLVSSRDIYNASIDYIQVRSIGIVFAFITFILNAFYVGITKTRILIYSTVIMSLVNVFLDYGLIFGNFGLPEMGIKGAALASVIAEVSACSFLLFATFNEHNKRNYNLFKFVKPDKATLLSILNLSIPIMFQSFVTLGSWYAFFSIIERMGEDELAVSHITRSIYMVMMIPMFGLSTSANTITSNLIGEGKSHMVLPSTWKIIGISLITTIPLAILTFTFSDTILMFYTDNSDLIPAAKNTLVVIDFSMLLFCVAYILFNSVTGTGNTKVSLLIEVVNITIYLTATFLIVQFFSPPIHIVWCAEFVYFFFLAIMAWYYLKFGNWRAKQL